MTGSAIFDDTPCTLGEGALWHPGRQALFWFDILNRRLYSRDLAGARQVWDFAEYVSAAGIIDDERLLVASQGALSVLHLGTGRVEKLVGLEADNPATRSNDGRADPQGGFWIGTMGIEAQPGAGAIWRYHRGELRRLFAPITISNAICFAPDGRHACFCDTTEAVIRRVQLDGQGWPAGEPEPWIDLRPEGLSPDGAVIDAEGGLWSAQWGAGRVARYDAQGRFDRAIGFAATQVSCPAFGGPDLGTLFVTSARQGLTAPQSADGRTFMAAAGIAGQAEHRVAL